MRSRAKVQLSRLTDLLFPELCTVCWSITQKSILALLKTLPGACKIASCRVDRIAAILKQHSRGQYGRAKAETIKALAQQSIGRESPALAFELTQVIETIEFTQQKIDELDKLIQTCVHTIQTPLVSIPGISYRLAAIILAEIGDISRFASPDKLLAFAGLEPSTYQSGNFAASHTPMTKRGSTYLRWALLQAARLVTMRCPEFNLYQARKLAQGKHYFTVLGHLAKKLVRVIFHILTTNEPYIQQIA